MSGASFVARVGTDERDRQQDESLKIQVKFLVFSEEVAVLLEERVLSHSFLCQQGQYHEDIQRERQRDKYWL